MKYLFLLLSLLVVSYAQAKATYQEKGDEFSNGKTYSVKITSHDSIASALFISCQSGELGVQLASTKTMFPNDSDGNGMTISTTFKFSNESEPVTSSWFMNLMKYNNAWYSGDINEFIDNAISSEKLSIRQNKRGDVYRFKLDDAKEYLAKVKSNCQ